MIHQKLHQEIFDEITIWEVKLSGLDESLISEPRNMQNRSIKQIVGHMIDSASNNTHRMIHLQYRDSPLEFPNYASHGNNDRWIAIQNYQHEDWKNLIALWKYIHLHFLHVLKNVQPETLSNQWFAEKNEPVTLQEMLLDFPRHFHLHLQEIQELIQNNK